MSNIKLEVKNLTKFYHGKNGKKDGIENINIQVKEGNLVTLLGPSGCGKTTILRAIGGFVKPDGGEIILDGKRVEKLPPNKRSTCMVFQSYNLWPHMNIHDNLAYGMKLRKISKPEIEKAIDENLKLVGIADMKDKFPAQMSGGQQQRVAIARALVLKPSMLLLDEPFSALDAKIRGQMREELKKIQTELNITILFVTHDQEEAMAISDLIIVMSKGTFEQVGAPSEIYDHPKTKFVAGFIGNMNFIPSTNGDDVLAVRPEDIILSSKKSDFLNGIVRTKMILGHFIEINIDTEKGSIKAFLPKASGNICKVGDEIGINAAKHLIFSN